MWVLGGDSMRINGRLGIRDDMDGVSAIAVDMALQFSNSEIGAKYIKQSRDVSVP